MKDEELRRSRLAEKITKIKKLMKELQIEAMPRQRVSQNGFIELVLSYSDYEQYPSVEGEQPNA